MKGGVLVPPGTLQNASKFSLILSKDQVASGDPLRKQGPCAGPRFTVTFVPHVGWQGREQSSKQASSQQQVVVLQDKEYEGR